MKKVILLTVLMLLSMVGMNGAESQFKFSFDKALVYKGSTEIILPELQIDPSLPAGTVTYYINNSEGVAAVDAQTGEITLKGGGYCVVNAKYSKNNLNARYELTVIDPKDGEYQKVTGPNDLCVGENEKENDYLLVSTNRLNNKDKELIYLWCNNGTLLGQRDKISSDYFFTSTKVYPKVLLKPNHNFQLVKVASGQSAEDNTYALKLRGTNQSDKVYVYYDTNYGKGNNLLLTDVRKDMKISFSEKGIVMSYIGEDNMMIDVDNNSTNFYVRKKINQTGNFALFKYQDFKTPEDPTVKVINANGTTIIDGTYNIESDQTEKLTFDVPEGVLVYYHWNPTVVDKTMVREESAIENWTRYTGEIPINEAGTLTYYSEQYGNQSEHKELNITKENNPTTSIMDIKNADDADSIYYTLDGQKLMEKPTKAGVYVVLKGGESKTMIIK